MYFVTICTNSRVTYFDNPSIHEIAASAWQAIPNHAVGVTLDEWVIMPNHLHGLLELAGLATQSPEPNTGTEPHGPSLANIVRTYKAAVTLACRRAGLDQFAWQRGYYEHVVRDRGELDRVRLYIRNNPAQWALDQENPEYKPTGPIKSA